MALRKKEIVSSKNIKQGDSLFQETKKVLKTIIDKEMEVKEAHQNGTFSNKKKRIQEAIENVEYVSEQIELENQLKQLKIDMKKDSSRAYYALFMPEEERMKAKEKYREELASANEILANTILKYKEVKFNVNESIDVLNELLNIYKNLSYVKELEYRLDKEKDKERASYLDLNVHQPYLSKISYVQGAIKEAEKYLKKQRYYEQKTFGSIENL